MRFTPSALLVCLAALALPVRAAELTVTDAWIRLLPAGVPAAGYFTLHNDSAHEVRLTGADTPAFGGVMLHRSMETDGMARMASVDVVAVPAGGEVRFAPGSYHLMLMQAKEALTPGGQVTIRLQFADGHTLPVPFVLRGPTGR